MEWIKDYEVACIQNISKQNLLSPSPVGKNDAIIRENLERSFELMDFEARSSEWTSDGGLKLIVLPEYGINGVLQSGRLKDWLNISVPIPGEYTDMIGKKAKELNSYIAANMMEIHEDWPDRFFNCSFIVSPEGKVILKHWKNNNNAFTYPYTTPSDVYSEFVERYGRKAIFPVVETPIGKLGLITCGELIYPENARCTALNGAEIIAHLTAELYDLQDWSHVKIARAMENKVYLPTCNFGVLLGTQRGVGSSWGKSMIISPRGEVLKETPYGPGEATIRARVDLDFLRKERTRPFWPSSLRAQMFAKEYADASGWPLDGFAKTPITGMEDTRKIFWDIVDKRFETGIYVKPDNYVRPSKVSQMR